MDKTELYDRFNQLEAQMQAMASQLSDLKTETMAVYKANAELQIENQRLQQVISEFKTDQPMTEEPGALSRSRQVLEKLYSEGFHVCREFYGTTREPNESCAFCIGVIYYEK